VSAAGEEDTAATPGLACSGAAAASTSAAHLVNHLASSQSCPPSVVKLTVAAMFSARNFKLAAWTETLRTLSFKALPNWVRYRRGLAEFLVPLAWQ